MVVLSYRFKRSSNFIPRASTLLAWADVRVGFPSALMWVVALMAFCSIHSFLCNCGDRMDRLDRHLTSGRPNVLLIIRIQSHIVLRYITITVPSFRVTHNNFYVEVTHSERCTLEDLNSYFYYYNVIIIIIIIIVIIRITFTYIILIAIIVIAIITIIIITIIIIILLVVVE